MLRSSEIKPAFTVGGGINRVPLQGGGGGKWRVGWMRVKEPNCSLVMSCHEREGEVSIYL